MLRIHGTARRRETAKEPLHHHRAECGQVGLRRGRQWGVPFSRAHRVERGLQAPSPAETGIVPVFEAEELAERGAAGTVRCGKQHPGGGRFLREAPRRLVHKEVADESRIAHRLAKLLGVSSDVAGKSRIEDVGKVAVDSRGVGEAGAQRPDVWHPREAGDLPVRPVRDGVEAVAVQLGDGDPGPVLIPFLRPKGADEVGRQVIEGCIAALADSKAGRVFAGVPRQPGQRRVQATIGRLDINAHTVHAGRPEGIAVRIHQPPPLAVMLRAEEAGRLELLVQPAAPAREVLRPALCGRGCELPAQAGTYLLRIAAFLRPTMQRALAHLIKQRSLGQQGLFQAGRCFSRGGQRRHAPPHRLLALA